MLSAFATSSAQAGPTFAAMVMMATLISSGSIDLCRHCSRGEAGGGGKMVTAKNFAS
jgi:hypothetical protein